MKKITFIFLVVAFNIFSAHAMMIAKDEGVTEFMTACKTSTPQEVEAMLAKGIDINRKTRVYGKTALDYALDNKRPFEMITLLLKNGANLSGTPELLNNAIEKLDNAYADPETPVQLEKTVFLLIDKNAVPDPDKALAEASMHCRNIMVFEKLLKAGANVNSRTTGESPPLIMALEYKNAPAVKFLLEHGADPNIRDFSDKPATYFATNNDDLKLLIRYGANLSAGVTIIDDWSGWIDPETLALAAKENCRISEQGMSKAGANPRLPQIYELLLKVYGKKPPVRLMAEEAIRHMMIENIEFLKKKGAEKELEKTDLFSAVLDSPYMSKPGQKEKMLEYLVKSKAPINAVHPRTGKTALMDAAHGVDLKYLKFLLENGADPNIFAVNRFNVLFYLAGNSYTDEKDSLSKLDALNLLVEHGAQLKQKTYISNLLLVALCSEQDSQFIKRLVELGEDVNFSTKDGITPLMLAAMLYKNDMVEFLIEKGAKVNAADITGWTPLFYACHYFYEAEPESDIMVFKPRNRSKADANPTVQLLLKHGADAAHIDNLGASPLTEAAAWASPETIKLLADSGGKKAVNAHDGHNRSAIMYAVKYNPDLKSVEALLQSGADPNVIMNEGSFPGRTMKFNRFHSGFNESENLSASNKKKYIGTGSCDGFSPPIFEAIYKNDVQLLALLLKYGADPNLPSSKNKDGRWTPLQACNSPEIEKMLLAAGAKAESYHKKSFVRDEAEHKLREACRNDDLDAVKKIFSELPPMDAADKKYLMNSAINYAAKSASLELLRFLITQNNGKFDDSILFAAAGNADHPEIIRHLAESMSLKLNSMHDDKGNTAMHYAGSPEIIEFLYKKGLDINARNNSGETPIISMYLRWEGHSFSGSELIAMMEEFLKCGADIDAKNSALIKEIFRCSIKPDERCLKILLKHGADPNTEIDGISLLDLAIKDNDPLKFEILIDSGASTTAIDPRKASPYIRKRLEEITEKRISEISKKR